MTGYGHSAKKLKIKHLSVEIQVTVKSVNGRFLEVRTSLPPEYEKFENEIKKSITNKLKRGSVGIYITRSQNLEEGAPEVKVNTKLAETIHKNFEALRKKLKIKTDVQLEHILRFPEVLSIHKNNEISKEEEKQLFAVIEKAIVLCEQERLREGSALSKNIKEYLEFLIKQKEFISKNAHMSESEMKQKYTDRLTKLGAKGDQDPARLAQEIIIMLDKMDVSEELTRLTEHLKVLIQLLQTSEQAGKKLEFYTQELFREFNTIGSKTQLPEITKCVIDSKVAIERIREQVQNIE